MPVLISTLSLLLFSSIASQVAGEALKVGDKIPDVSVTTAMGKALKLREAVADKPAVLIFYRGGWCPYCTKHLQALMDIEQDLTQTGYQLLAISPDQPKKLAETPDLEKLNYQLLSDSQVEAAKAFGLTFKVPDKLVKKYLTEYQIDIEAASGETHHLLPHPAVFVVDQKGIVRFAHVNPDYKKRLDPDKILKAAKKTAEQ
ncbi:MAG: peroxiredoxin-like family protein [Akkermansiaceae bacterium]|nr:peroxiredoxin-like family protein [Akkermansiaceae bacterium]